jgi:hypothetical protein
MSAPRGPSAGEPALGARCVAELGALIDALPGLLEQAVAGELPERPARLGTVVTTGIGASEPPARFLTQLLVAGGVPAQFVATSAFARGEVPRGDLLVSFSQGLSPNALLALGQPFAFSTRWLVTAVGPATQPADKRAQRAQLEAGGVSVVCLPPSEEPAWLVRMAGPTVAALGALRIAAHLLGDRALADAAEGAPLAYARGCLPESHAPTPLTSGRALALIALGTPHEAALAHRCKLMEALLVPEPPVWDVLQFAHGPLQAYFAAPLTLLSLECEGDHDLACRLGATLAPERHELRRLIAPVRGPCTWFSHAAAIDQLLHKTLCAAPRDLYEWPGKRCDGPLYDLGKTP